MVPQTFTIHDFFAPLPHEEQEAIRAEFEALYNHLETPVYLVDSFCIEDTLIACNQAFINFYGFERKELEGKDQAALSPNPKTTHEPSVLHSRALFLDHMRRERSRPAMVVRVHKDGHETNHPYLIQMVHMGGRDLLLHIMRSQSEAEPIIQNQDGIPEFQNLMRYQRDGMVLLDCATPRLSIADCNTSYAAMNGYARPELLGRDAFNFSPHQVNESPEVYEAWLRDTKETFIEQLRRDGEMYYLGMHPRKDGSLYTISVLQYLVYFGEREYILTTIRDMTEWGHLQNLEQARSNLLQHIASSAPISTSLSNMVEIVEHQISQARCAILLHNRQQNKMQSIVGKSFSPEFTQALCVSSFHAIPKDQSHSIVNAAVAQRAMQFIDPMSTPKRWEMDNLIPLVPEAQACWALPISSMNTSSYEALGAILIYLPEPKRPQISEINFLNSMVNLATIAIEQHRFVEKLAYQAEHDNLTGLPNRVLFQDRLEQTIARCKRQNVEFGVLFLDLDGFKHVNDTLGHSAGDTLLREIAGRLQQAVRGSDTVARLGGDEFTVILPDVKVPQDIVTVARKIADAIKKPMEIHDHEIAVTSSIGIAVYPRDGRDAETLQQKADAAMYQAKSSGKDCHFFYRDSLGEALQAKQNLKCQLKHAFENQEFEVWYQPQLSTHKGELLGFEALLRWKHPELGLMLPASFIPAAEESGIILHIGEWVVRQACENLKQWRKTTSTDLRVAVNVSSIQLENSRFPSTIENIIKETGLPPSSLEIDLAESIVIRNLSESARPLEKLHDLGIRIAIDDFATSYSSLRYLQKLPINTVKLDHAFVQGIDEQRALRLLAESVIVMAHERNLQVLAEGVQTQAELQTLKQLNCDAVQGYFLARPLPVHEVTNFLRLNDL